MSPNMPLWKLFYQKPPDDPDSAFSQQDTGHKKAWCIAEINENIAALKRAGSDKTDVELHTKALMRPNLVKYISGRSDQMLKHLRTCHIILTSQHLMDERNTVVLEYELSRIKKLSGVPLSTLAASYVSGVNRAGSSSSTPVTPHSSLQSPTPSFSPLSPLPSLSGVAYGGLGTLTIQKRKRVSSDHESELSYLNRYDGMWTL
ncbi:hypothetical protein V5O48_014490 [Marasmius crinis-equi]|uniref:Uncharacterized protein n=1 Tax=Marasmius crinis-equi TaxID=585013 RepID=A0ABR3EX77_9AGAR